MKLRVRRDLPRMHVDGSGGKIEISSFLCRSANSRDLRFEEMDSDWMVTEQDRRWEECLTELGYLWNCSSLRE